ncbi:protein NATD1-like [Micropterus salmoides]|uniref:protein NATD1-like n=1 Tax=Micropterus salmoides TaxID=27706 RepID=UPI0018EDAD9D|nr:protein NATD1-like [Micropterus salmoides]XP_045899595.1 protein NATD1-like [Micropterus dolomieu]
MFSRVTALTLRVNGYPAAFSALSSGFSLMVKHDRQNQRFTVNPGSGAGAHDCAVLHYRFTGEKEVDLMSTYVPDTFRGQGVAALLSQAAMDFLVEENLKAHVSCWYIKKYIEDHPLQHYKDLVIT